MLYAVKDMQLADSGKRLIEYAERQMGALLTVRDRFAKDQPFAGMTIGMALHVTKETAVLVRTLRAGGATVAIAGCNPLSTQDDVAAALAAEGVAVFAWKGQQTDEYYKNLRSVIEVITQGEGKIITIDDGCDLVTLIHKEYAHLLPRILGGCEETTTGVTRLHAMEKDGALRCAMIAVNDNKTKHLMDNYYGTGQSTIDGILRASNVLFAGKTVVVAGYGSCGKGVALRAKGLSANVVVTEVDPFCALQAAMDGYRVMPMAEAARIGDIFVTVTGNKHVLRKEHFAVMREGALLANSGHFDLEIDVAGLAAMATTKRAIRPLFDEYTLPDGRVVFLLGEGRLVNLATAEGHPSEVMALSFCGQALACLYLKEHAGQLAAAVHTLPAAIDMEIAALHVQAKGMTYDTMTEEQKAYVASWQEGT